MKPLLSELFLPCSGMHSPIRANRYPLATITGAQRASGQTHSRARSHQDDADLRADRSTAYLVSCIRVRSAHGNSFVESGTRSLGQCPTTAGIAAAWWSLGPCFRRQAPRLRRAAKAALGLDRLARPSNSGDRAANASRRCSS